MHDKKAIFNLILVLGAIGILIYTYIVLNSIVYKSGVIGEKENHLLNIYHNSTKDLFYIDKSAEYSFLQSIGELNNFGGYYITPKCLYYNSYVLWQTKTENCIPKNEEISERLKSMTHTRLNKYLQLYKLKKLPVNNYDYFIYSNKQTNLIGIALENLFYEYTSPTIKYSVKPSFHVAVDYDIFSHYEHITKTLIQPEGFFESVIKCENGGENLDKCVRGQISKTTNDLYGWSIDCDNKFQESDFESRIFPFCVEDKQHKILYFDNAGKISSRNPVIKFAAYIADLPPEPLEGQSLINPMGEDSYIILKWKKPPESDVMNYKIYFSENDFSDLEIENNILAGKDIRLYEPNPGDILNPVLFEPLSCSFETAGEKCVHALSYIGTDNNAQSLEKRNNNIICAGEYCYFITNQDLKDYVYITAVDKSGNRQDKFEKAIDIKKKDNLAPGKVSFTLSYDPAKQSIDVQIGSIGNNADGSAFSNDLKKYYVFMQKGTAQDIITLGNLRENTEISMEEPPSSGDVFYVAVLAADNSDNPISKISAVESTDLVINPEYNKIITELANPQSITIP